MEMKLKFKSIKKKRLRNSFINILVENLQKCFFRQFFRSVAKVDYLTLRHGFISVSKISFITFNFTAFGFHFPFGLSNKYLLFIFFNRLIYLQTLPLTSKSTLKDHCMMTSKSSLASGKYSFTVLFFIFLVVIISQNKMIICTN